jgi:alpha-mannosidase
MAEVSARVRRAVEKLRNAEALAALVSLENPGFMTGREAERDQAWVNLGLYWEHAWTADSTTISREARAAWERRTAQQIEHYVDALHRDAAKSLGSLIRGGKGASRFFVFNALSWSRTDYADLAWSDLQPVHVTDLTTSQTTPSQIVTNGGQHFLRVLAQDVPSTGYKVFEVQSGPGQPFSDAATVRGNTLENAFYTIAVAERGAITSLLDRKNSNRQLARIVEGRAMNDLGAGPGELQVENAGPVSVTLRATASAPVAHTTRITLIRDKDRIEMRNDITQNFADVQTWNFSFNLSAPDLWHEEIGAVIRAKLVTAGGHYSPRNARYDWLTLNHFADLSDGDHAGVGVTLSSADCAFMKFGSSIPQALDTSTPQLSVLAGGQVDGPTLGIPRQGGDTFFTQRFALRSRDRFQAVEAMKFALEHQNPLVTGLVTGGNALPENSFSLLQVSNSAVVLWALKCAEAGITNGLVARVWNLSSEPQRFSLALATGVTRGERTTHIETDLANAPVVSGAVAATCSPMQILTFRLVPGALPRLKAGEENDRRFQ